MLTNNKLFLFTIVLSMLFSLSLFAETEPNGTCSNAHIVELNSTQQCFTISGNVGAGNVVDKDIYKIYLPDSDNNLTYIIQNDSGTTKLEYAYLEGCNDPVSPSTTTIGNGNTETGSQTNIASNEYRYIYLTGGSNNAITPYTLDLKLPGCSGGGGGVIVIEDYMAEVDIADGYSGTGNTYASWITTKVSKKNNYTLNAVYLGTGANSNSTPQPYTPTGNQNQTPSISVLLKLADFSAAGTTCATATPIGLYTVTPGGNIPVVAIIDSGETSDLTNPFMMAYAPDRVNARAMRDVRFMYKSVDFSQLILDSGINCAQKSSTGGVAEGIPSCLIAEPNDDAVNQNMAIQNYITIFGQNAYDNCYTANGEPCAASNGGVGAYPYDHEYGCFECSLGGAPYRCSKDNFAIRPDHFDINTADPDSPNLLRAGEDYNHTVYAYDYGITSGTIGSLDYNQTAGVGGNIDLNQSRFMATGVADDGTLHGNLVWSAWDFNMTNGISNQNGDLTQTEVAGVQYDDVGKINLRAEDKEWASVDINNPNDPTPHNCTPDGAYLCSDKNVTYIPHHFGFEELNITNHAGPDSNFTYIADNRGMPSATPPTRSPMAARVQTQIRALTKNNTITQNFRADDANHPYNDSTLYYENDVRVNLAVTIPATGTNSYLYPDANESSTTNAANPNTYNYIGFGRSGLDANGTRNIYWNESNFPLEFNFQRKINEPANPFDVNGSYLSISIHSIYTDASTPSSPADINGSRIGDQNGSTTCATDEGCVELNADSNATFYYARTRPSKFFYDDITSSSAVTPIFIDVYCDLGFTACDAFDIDTVNGQINDADWWLSWEHSKSQGDGNITLSASANGSVSAPPKPNIDASGGADKTVTVTHGSITLPDIVDIDFNPATDAWLIHNPDNPWTPSPFYRVRFIGQSGWTGVGKTGNVLDTGISTKKSKRLDW